MANTLRDKARALKQQICVVYLAARHPQTPWYVKALAAVIVAYACSPIDLVPDFVPVLGYLDDVILLPLGIALLLKLTPPEILEQCRADAEQMAKRPVSRVAGAVVILIWIASMALCIYLLRAWL